MTAKYKKYWLGKCIEAGMSVNLEEGKMYLLKDKTGEKEHFNVSPFISNSDAFFGSYRGSSFEVMEDVTEAVLALPYENGILKYQIHLGMVNMIVKQKGLNYIDAQQYLIDKQMLYEPVVDSKGVPLLDPTEVGKSGKRRRPDFEYTPMPEPEPDVPNRINPKIMEPASKVDYGDTANYIIEGESAPREVAETPRETVSPQSVPEKPKSAEKPRKTADTKPKFVQKGLFG